MVRMWIVCTLGQWILTVLSVVHYTFTQSPSTVATVAKFPYLLYVLFLPQYTPY